MEQSDFNNKIRIIHPDVIKFKDIKLPNSRLIVLRDIIKIIEHFFKSPDKISIPFRGFLLEGPPGNGKTELIYQIYNRIHENVF